MKHYKGISLLVLCTALYGLYGIYSRMIAMGFGVFSQNWIRNVFVLLFACIGLMVTKKRLVPIAKKDLVWVLSWIISDIVFVIAIFFSFNHIHIGTSLFLLYAGATIASYIGGTIFLKEALTKIKLLAILISLTGLTIIYGGQVSSTPLIYLLIGFMTGVFSAAWNIFPKLISHDYPKLQLIIFDAGGILLVNLLFGVYVHQYLPTGIVPLAWVGLLLYAITQFFGDLLLIYSFRLVEVHIGSLIMPLEALFGALFAYILFKESLTPATIIGGIVILIGATLPNLFTTRLHKE